MGGQELAVTKGNISRIQIVEWLSKTLYELALRDDRVVGLSADIGTSNKMDILSTLPVPRFINAGLAEQNLVSMAAGLALGGMIPFVSTFAVFLSMRAVEQVRTDVVYPRLNVKLIGSHAGLSFSVAGTTHNCIEDISILRSMPNLKIVCPADGPQLRKALIAAYETEGPIYLRISRGLDPVVTEIDADFILGKNQMLRDGSDVTVMCHGRTVAPALAAAEALQKGGGISVRVLNCHTIKPADRTSIAAAARETGAVLTVEDHNVIGGLGSLVSEIIAEEGIVCRFRRIGIPDSYTAVAKSHTEAMDILGYGVEGIKKNLEEMVRGTSTQDRYWRQRGG